MTPPDPSHQTAHLPMLDTAPGYRRVADLIEAEIMAGRVKVGDLLPTEISLAEMLGVHRSTVREGIRALENSGLVKRVGAKRLKVVVPDENAVAWANTRALGMRGVSFTELWQVQMQLEPFSARLAAQGASDALKDGLRDNVAALRQNIDDDQKVIASDLEFHRLVAEAGGNGVLMLSVAPVGMLLFSATVGLYQAVEQARNRLLEAHSAIAAAIIDEDPDTAALWMARHIEDFRRGYEVGGLEMDAPIPFDAHGGALK